jgi:hypothetical protein
MRPAQDLIVAGWSASPETGCFGMAMAPHAPKAECDRAAEEGLIYGCGKPFCFDGVAVVICDCPMP